MNFHCWILFLVQTANYDWQKQQIQNSTEIIPGLYNHITFHLIMKAFTISNTAYPFSPDFFTVDSKILISTNLSLNINLLALTNPHCSRAFQWGSSRLLEISSHPSSCLNRCPSKLEKRQLISSSARLRLARWAFFPAVVHDRLLPSFITRPAFIWFPTSREGIFQLVLQTHPRRVWQRDQSEDRSNISPPIRVIARL